MHGDGVMQGGFGWTGEFKSARPNISRRTPLEIIERPKSLTSITMEFVLMISAGEAGVEDFSGRLFEPFFSLLFVVMKKPPTGGGSVLTAKVIIA